MKTIILFFGIALIAISAKTQNQVKYNADKVQTYITYSMSHPLHEWDATSRNINSVLIYNTDSKKIEKVAVSIPVSTFDSQNANRDSHMIEVIEGIKFPTVTFVSTSITESNNKQMVTGNIVFHGVTHQITFEINSKITDQRIEVTGGFTVKMSEYNIENPSLMGMPTKDEIVLKINAVYKPK
jgi:polyisoprenoid-binding protein YceI